MDGFLNHHILFKFPLDLTAAVEAHGFAFGEAFDRHFVHFLVQIFGVFYLAQKAGDAFVDGFFAAVDAARDHRAAGGGGFQEDIAQTLMVAGQHHAVCGGVVGGGLGLEAVEHGDAIFYKLIYFGFVIVIKETYQIQDDFAA